MDGTAKGKEFGADGRQDGTANANEFFSRLADHLTCFLAPMRPSRPLAAKRSPARRKTRHSNYYLTQHARSPTQPRPPESEHLQPLPTPRPPNDAGRRPRRLSAAAPRATRRRTRRREPSRGAGAEHVGRRVGERRGEVDGVNRRRRLAHQPRQQQRRVAAAAAPTAATDRRLSIADRSAAAASVACSPCAQPRAAPSAAAHRPSVRLTRPGARASTRPATAKRQQPSQEASRTRERRRRAAAAVATARPRFEVAVARAADPRAADSPMSPSTARAHGRSPPRSHGGPCRRSVAASRSPRTSSDMGRRWSA